MANVMTFPKTVDEFMEQYKVVDEDHVYSNGTAFVPIFRMKQWFEHLKEQTDVRPVVRGKWKPIDLTYGRNYYFCSACEDTVDMPTAMGIPMFRYCPNCGADMREGS